MYFYHWTFYLLEVFKVLDKYFECKVEKSDLPNESKVGNYLIWTICRQVVWVAFNLNSIKILKSWVNSCR